MKVSDSLIEGFSTEQLVLTSAFFRYSTEKMSKAHDNSTRFVHYTSAENALRILSNKEITLRNSRLMNDFSEGQYGLDIINRLFSSPTPQRSRFQSLFESIHIGLPAVVDRYFAIYGTYRFTHTFMLSLSEHGNAEINEDQYGRLSMWRAYGGETNVALVVNNKPLLSPTDALKAYTSPIVYADSSSFTEFFDSFLNNTEEMKEQLSELPMDVVARNAAYSLYIASLSIKHPAFIEEREWRIIYSPKIESSNYIIPDIIPIGGVPQRIYKIPLRDIQEDRLTGMTIPELLDRILIGPTEYPWPIYDAFVQVLEDQDFPGAAERVWTTNIPLRK